MKKITAIATILVGVIYTVKAQPGSTGGFNDEPQDIPVDGGIVLLALAGAAYGYIKLKNNNEFRFINQTPKIRHQKLFKCFLFS